MKFRNKCLIGNLKKEETLCQGFQVLENLTHLLRFLSLTDKLSISEMSLFFPNDLVDFIKC